MGPPIGNVFANKFAVMGNGDVLTPALGKTCDATPTVCTNPRVVRAANFTFVNKVAVAVAGNVLNARAGITIPIQSCAIDVFA